MSTERRKGDDRKQVSLVVEYDDAAELHRDYTENLSTGGVFIHTDRALAIGDEVQLMLSFPGLLQSIGINGTVRWTKPVDDEASGVGIEFVNFDGDARKQLEGVLEHINNGDPRFVQRVLRILLVEDNPHVAALIREGLGSGRFSDAAFSFRVASNGAEALDVLMAESFDVLVIDVNLPQLDGPTVISRVRKEARYASLPVIAVSAGGKEAGREALAAGADFFLEKPMRLRQIIESMRKLLGIDL